MTITPQSFQRGIALIVVMMAVFVLSVLAGAFNRMHRSLAAAMKMLDKH